MKELKHRNKIHNTNFLTKKNLLYSISIITGCIVILIIIYVTKSNEHFSNKKQKPFLNKIKLKCNDPYLVPAFSPDICCRMQNNKLKCDYKRNCKCKNKKTGICETCYPKSNIK